MLTTTHILFGLHGRKNRSLEVNKVNKDATEQPRRGLNEVQSSTLLVGTWMIS